MEAPEQYPSIPALLDRAEPRQRDLFYVNESWPGACEREEADLRTALLGLENSAAHTAIGKVSALEEHHGPRRGWVWARLGKAPLARALAALDRMATLSKQPTGGATPDEIAGRWADSGWQVDAAALEALASVESSEDVKAVRAAIRAIYLPWLEGAAEQLQTLARQDKLGASSPLGSLQPGTCVLFADGLRLDVGRLLESKLKGLGLNVVFGWRWAPLPTVTSTAKPAVSPVVSKVCAGRPADFETSVASEGRALTAERFRRLLEDDGITPLSSDALGDPLGRAWTEAGSLDRYGHDQGWKLARRVSEEVKELAGRIKALLEAGWKEIRVVTDHGWLLVPGELPKVQLPSVLTESRWGRCATLREAVESNLLRVPWHWKPTFWVALAPKVSTFYKGMEYAHGGLSVQECVTPVLTVTSGAPKAKGKIVSVKWTGLKCRVSVTTAAEGSTLDLRTKANDPATSVVKSGSKKTFGGDAEISLFADDEHAGTAVSVVLIAGDGTVVTKGSTTVGG